MNLAWPLFMLGGRVLYDTHGFKFVDSQVDSNILVQPPLIVWISIPKMPSIILFMTVHPNSIMLAWQVLDGASDNFTSVAVP
jgi:hypothetical protein